jgi:hypothetical protein
MRIGKSIGLGLAVAMLLAGTATAQDEGTGLNLDGGPSASAERGPTTQELRQARAWERQRQRIARIEAREWMGYDPLRPTRGALPFTTSRYHVVLPHHGFAAYGMWPLWGVQYVR